MKLVRDPDSSDASKPGPVINTASMVEAKNGVESGGIPEGISEETMKHFLCFDSVLVRQKVRFDDVPLKIEPVLKVDEYDILWDIKSRKVNVTIGQLLHDNVNYQKLICDAKTKKRKQRVKLPSMATNFLQIEDQGAMELTVVVDGCVIRRVPVDGGSGVNLMLQDTTFDLGYTSFESSDQVLRIADQSKVLCCGETISNTHVDWGSNVLTQLRHHLG